MHKKATIYSKPDCIWCERAKQILSDNNIEYEEYKLGTNLDIPTFRALFPEAKTVPQIKVDGVYVGGHDDLVEFLKK